MADPIGAFEFQMKNNSFTKEADGTIVTDVDFEGIAGDFGTGLGLLGCRCEKAVQRVGYARGRDRLSHLGFPGSLVQVMGPGNRSKT